MKSGLSALNLTMAHIYANLALQEMLGSIERPDEFVDRLVAIADGFGIVLAPAMVEDALANAGRRGAAETTARCPPPYWLPYRADSSTIGLDFEWCWFGRAPLTDPFFGDSVRRMSNRPFGRLSRMRTSLSALDARSEDTPRRTPDGFIFHLSRSGSTLASQMLAAMPHHLVISEAQPIEATVCWANSAGIPFAEANAALQSVIAALGRDRSGSFRRYFVKLDAWHALSLPLFRRAFPGVPWMFIYRDPVEVLVSHALSAGMHMVPGLIPDLVADALEGAAASLPDYQARSLGRIMAAALDGLKLGGGLLVNYRDIVSAMTSEVPRHFGFTPNGDELEAMIRASQRDAKNPARIFVDDQASKRAAARHDVLAAARASAVEPYRNLERARWQNASSKAGAAIDSVGLPVKR